MAVAPPIVGAGTGLTVIDGVVAVTTQGPVTTVSVYIPALAATAAKGAGNASVAV